MIDQCTNLLLKTARGCREVTITLVSVQPRWYDATSEVIQIPRKIEQRERRSPFWRKAAALTRWHGMFAEATP